MITVSGPINRTPDGLPFSVRGFHLLRNVGDVLRLTDANHRTVRSLAYVWQRKTGQKLAVLARGDDTTVWVLRTA